ncbi:hypothetical protein C8Q79DRAFT_1119719 [Trametes meyenii]|nr:hypothetical protein C8Q79DRAFT_1119719 [Trametes meyenii]
MAPPHPLDGLLTSSLFTLPKLGNTLGAVLLGSIFGFMLYGLMLHQTYRYYRMYPADGLVLKGLVFVIVVAETLHTALWITVCYEYLINNYFNPLNLIETHWYIQLTIPMTAITGLFSQTFYAGRVYFIGPQYRPLVAIAVIVMLLSLAWDFVATVKVFHAPTLQAFSHYSWIVSVAYGLAVLCDLITASALILALLRSRTGVRRTDSVVEVLVLYTVNTGLLTTIVGLLVFVFALVHSENLIYAGLSIPGVKLYSNSVLAMLNSRQSLSARMNDEAEDGLGVPGRVHPQAHQSAGVGALETWAVCEMPVSFAVTGSTTRSYVEEGAGDSSQPSLGGDGLSEKCGAIEDTGNGDGRRP